MQSAATFLVKEDEKKKHPLEPGTASRLVIWNEKSDSLASFALGNQIRLGTVQTGRHLRLSHLFYSTYSAKNRTRKEPNFARQEEESLYDPGHVLGEQ